MVEVGVVLGDVEYRRRRDPIQLVTARSLHGVDDRECPADAEGPLGGEGARPDVLRHLDLALARLELVAEGEPGNETEHRHEPRIARQVVDECLHALEPVGPRPDRKSTRLNSSHVAISYAVFCLTKKKKER